MLVMPAAPTATEMGVRGLAVFSVLAGMGVCVDRVALRLVVGVCSNGCRRAAGE